MKIRFAVVAAASALVALPSWGQGIQVGAATNITIGGLLAVGVKNSEITQGNAAVDRMVASETRVDDNTSRLIISSTSKITEGWNMIFRIESRFNSDIRPVYQAAAYNGWADGDTWGGVSSPYGSLVVGKSTLYYTDTISAGYLAPTLEAPGEGYRIWDDNGLASFNMLSAWMSGNASAAGVFTPVANNKIMGNSRASNVIRYDSITLKPTGSDLLDFSLAWSKQPQGDENRYVSLTNGSTYEGGATIYGRVRYNGYGFSASASYIDQKPQPNSALVAPSTTLGALGSELKAMRLGVSYKWQGLKFGVVYDDATQTNGINTAGLLSDAKRTIIEVPVSYSFGDHGIYATYTMAGKTSSFADTGAKQLNFGYDYALTKRAFVGVYYTKIDNDKNANYGPFLAGTVFGGTIPAQGESFRQVGINLNYWF
jgi:predicted porin